MSENEDNNLIGYDPLAWMAEAQATLPEPEEQSSAGQAMEIENEAEPGVDVAEAPQFDELAASGTDSAPILLASVLNIQQVASFHEELLKALDHADKIEIDASEVNAVDTASLQLLLVFKQEALKNGKEVVIDFPSEKFIEAADLLGVSQMLEIDQAAAGFF